MWLNYIGAVVFGIGFLFVCYKLMRHPLRIELVGGVCFLLLVLAGSTAFFLYRTGSLQ